MFVPSSKDKPLGRLLLMLGSLLFFSLLVSCSTSSGNPGGNPVDTIDDIPVPDDFDYDTTRDLNIDLSATGDLGEPIAFAVLEFHLDEESTPLLKALTDAEGRFSSQVSIAGHSKVLHVALKHPDYQLSQSLSLSDDSTLSISFSSQANLQTSSGNPSFLTCPSLAFLFQNDPTDAYGVNLALGSTPLLAEDVSASGTPLKLNAIGFSMVDSFIYGYDMTHNDGHIVRVGSDYEVVRLGPIQNLPSDGYYVGDVSADGKLYLTKANYGQFHVVDVTESSSTYLQLLASVNLSQTLRIYDWAFNPLDQNIYAVQNDSNGSHLFRIDASNGQVEDLGATGIPRGTYGAGYYDASGYFYVSNNSTGGIYRIDTSNPAALSAATPIDAQTQVEWYAQGPTSGNNDGARCQQAPSPSAYDDSDGDGVPDSLDDYPLDPDKVFNNYAQGALAFEDRWPLEDDYDFNDVVIDYVINQITNASNQVTSIDTTFTFTAAGAAFANAFAIELPFAPEVIASISGADVNYAGEWAYLNFNANRTEANQSQAVVFISDDIGRTLGYLVNTEPGGKNTTPQSVSVTIDLASPQDFGGLAAPYNPFIVANVDGLDLAGFDQPRKRGVEIHLPNYAPTDLADMSLFGTGDDNSNIAAGRTYLTEGNLPWALHVPESFAYPIERAEIIQGHTKFAPWAGSGGSNYRDWYQGKQGYRNNGFIY